MSIPKVKEFLSPDQDWESSFWGRLNQGRRELAVVLRKDVTAEKLAELIELSGPALAGWKRGSQPKKPNLEALERLFQSAGLTRYTAEYLDWGDRNALRELGESEELKVGKSASRPITSKDLTKATTKRRA